MQTPSFSLPATAISLRLQSWRAGKVPASSSTPCGGASILTSSSTLMVFTAAFHALETQSWRMRVTMAEQKTPVGIITHDEMRANIPPAELEPVLDEADRKPIRTAWERRNRDLDPQLVWRGKDPDQ